jgi:hypothetical protein
MIINWSEPTSNLAFLSSVPAEVITSVEINSLTYGNKQCLNLNSSFSSGDISTYINTFHFLSSSTYGLLEGLIQMSLCLMNQSSKAVWRHREDMIIAE